MAKNTLVVSIEYCCRYELKVIWHCSKNACRSSGLEPLNMSGAQMWDWFVVGGLGGGTAIFWLIVSSACTNCWTGSIALVDGCTEAGGDCCRVGGMRKLRNGGGGMDGSSPWPLKSSITGSPSSRASALSRTSASKSSISSPPGSSLACSSSTISCWRGLATCGCGVTLRTKSMLATLMAICGRVGGSAISPAPVWIGEGLGSTVLPVGQYHPQ